MVLNASDDTGFARQPPSEGKAQNPASARTRGNRRSSRQILKRLRAPRDALHLRLFYFLAPTCRWSKVSPTAIANGTSIVCPAESWTRT